MMVVKLRIEEDAELRQHVKELISGQVKSVIREEIKDILREVLDKKVKDTPVPNVDFLLKEEMRQIIRQHLDIGSYNKPSFIQKEAKKIVNDHVTAAFKNGNIVS